MGLVSGIIRQKFRNIDFSAIGLNDSLLTVPIKRRISSTLPENIFLFSHNAHLKSSGKNNLTRELDGRLYGVSRLTSKLAKRTTVVL